MPGMPSQHLDPTNAHLKAAGQRLQDARLAQDISVDTVMRELKVTRLQIAGIESGNPKSFYNESFFIDLLKRYARLLNFSETAIAKMVTPPVLEVVESASLVTEPAGETAPPAATQTSALPTPGSAQVNDDVGSATPTQAQLRSTVVAADAQDELAADSAAASPRSGSRRWMGLLALGVLVGVGIAVGLQVTDSNQSTTVASAPMAQPAPPATPQDSAAPVTTSSEPATSEAKPAAEPVTPVPASAPASPPEKPEPEPEQTASKTIVDTPMVLTAKRKSWIWVRDASDQVRQFGVAEGQTVKFDQLPIYIVVHDPTGFEVVIGNKVIPLVRNNEERNVARHTRTDLINFYK